jgi:predicted ATPase
MQTTVSPLEIVLGSITLLYGEEDQGKSFLLKSIAGEYHRRNDIKGDKKKITVTNNPAIVYDDSDYASFTITSPSLYASYFNLDDARKSLRNDVGLTVG